MIEIDEGHSGYKRDFLFEITRSGIFSAFMLAIKTRKKEDNLRQGDIGKAIGKEKTGISKLLSAPTNWTIRTISDLAFAINVDVEIILRDRKNPRRSFTSSRIIYETLRIKNVSEDIWKDGQINQVSSISLHDARLSPMSSVGAQQYVNIKRIKRIEYNRVQEMQP